MFDRINEGMYWDQGLRLVEGCTPVSEGCLNCWAKKNCHIRKHQKNMKIRKQYSIDCTDKKGNWTGIIHILKQNLEIPLRIKKPTVFSIWNDLFHKDIPDTFILSVWERMASCPQHTFIILTKRPKKMKHEIIGVGTFNFGVLPNVWIGVTAENQNRADERIPILLEIPAAKRIVSIEPMLDAINLTDIDEGDCFSNYLTGDIAVEGRGHAKINKIDWVICGGETGSKARPIHHVWVRNLRDQCTYAGVPFFFKKFGNKKSGRILDGREWNECPDYKFPSGASIRFKPNEAQKRYMDKFVGADDSILNDPKLRKMYIEGNWDVKTPEDKG